MAAYLTLTALEVRSSFGFDNSFIEYNSNTQYQAMLSWQPQIDHTIWQKDNLSISSFMEFSSSLRLDLTDEAQNYSPEAEVYRSWIRFANSSSELRVGLQKLNFGTARIFRPLQWFDQLQFLDLFERTGGTMAILMRKHFTQTGSLWLWGVTEDLDATYKYPLSLSESGLGGRYELSLPWLESAFSFHHRYGHSMPEKHRIGFETRLDGWIGFWTESSLLISKTKQQSNMLSLSNTCGLDYTIPWKNGLYLLAETNAQHSNSHLLSKVEPVDVQA
ncbi:MAG: hypothetical protein PHI68_01325, partial [Candidatus Cloacimonetes bacterium]|nr:hypothetical protein [Candidatus Cloacimonadota bacterium]